MKTLKEIIDDVAREDFPEYGGLAEGIHLDFSLAVAKRSAEEALDEVKQRIDGLDSLEPVSDCMEYINNIKNQLK